MRKITTAEALADKFRTVRLLLLAVTAAVW